MANKKLMAKLLKLDGAVQSEYDPFTQVLKTSSPSVNFCFGNTWGLPLGYTLALYGPPKGGKSLLINSMIGQMHRDYPEAVAIKFNTEMRELVQLTPAQRQIWGIDSERYIAFEVNTPEGVFDRIEKDIAAAVQEGLDVKLIAIDSLNSVLGRRMMNATSVGTQQIGDKAQTYQDGLGRVLNVLRKYNISLILSLQVRAELDQHEQMRGNSVKMAAAWGVKHYAEYYMYVEMDPTKASRQDLLGNDLVDAEKKDLRGRSEQVAHHIRVCMKDSSVGPKGRYAAFTLKYDEGIINTHEEIFLLGLNLGIIQKPNQLSYEFANEKWTGKPAIVEAIRDDSALAQAILRECMKLDTITPHVTPEDRLVIADET